MPNELVSTDKQEIFPDAEGFAYVERLKLEPKKEIEIDTTQSLLDVPEVQKEMGVQGRLIAGVRAGGMSFLLLDTRSTRQYQTPFLITTDTYEHNSTTGYKGIHPDEPVVIGRHHYVSRFQYDKKISRDHFSVTYSEGEDKLFIQDEGSVNGTLLTGYVLSEKRTSQRDIHHEFTSRVVEDVEHGRSFGDRDSETPYGYYRNHPIIGRRSATVRGGVYGTRESEFIVVDDKSQLLKQTVDAFMGTLPSGEDAETLSTQMILNKITLRVANIMRYDLGQTERMSRPHYGNKGLIDLSEYVEQGVGVCRHQALLAAHLIEEVISRGYLAGRVGVERNHDLEANGAHAWAVYKSDTSADVIVDVAQSFVGSRKRAQQEGRWRYMVANDDN
jgi:hypothetical protein